MICSICLEGVRKPVVTPCGHIFCFECLVSSSQKSPDAKSAPCPTCRASFSLVTPDQAFVPQKYRSFIDSNIRRVYLDDSQEVALQQKVAQLESRVKSLETDKDLLMSKCASQMTAITSHSRREKEARLRCIALEKELDLARAKVAEMGLKTQSILPLRSGPPTPPVDRVPLRIRLPSAKDPRPAGKREADVTRGIQPSTESFTKSFRPTIPLPKRRRVLLRTSFSQDMETD